MTLLKWTSRIAVVVTTALSVWRLWKAWNERHVGGSGDGYEAVPHGASTS